MATAKKSPKNKAASVAAKKPAVATKTRAPRYKLLDPAAQLDKLSADPPARATRSRGLDAQSAPPAGPQLPANVFGAYTGEALGPNAFAEAAALLGCEVAAVKAVAEVESRGSGFDAKNRPTILYERHVFARCCNPKGKFNASNPDISASTPYPKGTFGNTEQQWEKLAKAYALDPEAACKAPSWGIFQILGENHRACGFATAIEYARAMTTSPVAHLKAFVGFVQSDRRLLKAIRERDWPGFALAYNGKGYEVYQYDKKIATAYAKHRAAG
jgi:N-acetylmuramidase